MKWLALLALFATHQQPPRRVEAAALADGANVKIRLTYQLTGGPDSVFTRVNGGTVQAHRRAAIGPATVADSFTTPRPAPNATINGLACVQVKRRGLLSVEVCSSTPWTYTEPDQQPPPPVVNPPTVDTTAFDDTFARAGVCAKAATVAGWGWGLVNVGATDSVRVVADPQSPSGCALAVIYQGGPSGDDGWAEPRFTVGMIDGQHVQEIFVGFVVKVPTNYAHRNDSPSNNKLLRVWDLVYNNSVAHVGMSTLSSGSTGQSNVIVEWSNTSNVTGNWGTGPWSRVFLPGATDTVGFYAKVASGLNVKDGVIKVWLNRRAIYARTDVDNNTSSTAAGSFAGFGNGYLLGWANSGFAERTELRVWRFVLATKPVSWFLPT